MAEQQTTEEITSLYCPKCRRTMKTGEFYKSKNLEKYPTGYYTQCKKCMSLHIDNWDPSTYTWILQELDIPYVPEEWNKLLAKFAQDPSKVTGLTIIGRYVAKMYLKKWKDYHWADTQFLQEIERKRMEESMRAQGYTAQQIATSISQAIYTMPEKPLEIPQYPDDIEVPIGSPVPQCSSGTGSGSTKDGDSASDDADADYFDTHDSPSSGEEIVTLTEDEKTYMRLKWGKSYRPDEWAYLESLYNQMLECYDIQAAGDLNTLILACKSSLKANQMLDIGDIEGAQKAAKMYDSFMKSGKWTAVQNKTEQTNELDCIGLLAELCEKEGYHPHYHTDSPNDKADKVILDLQQYTRSLVIEELGLGSLIENAVKNIAEERETIAAHAKMLEKAEETGDDIDEDADLWNYNPTDSLTPQDYQDFAQIQEEMREQDAATIPGIELRDEYKDTDMQGGQTWT